MEGILLTILFALLFGVIWVWVQVIQRFQAERPILQIEPRAAVPWGFANLILVIVMIAGFSLLAFAVLHNEFGDATLTSMADMPPNVAARYLAYDTIAKLATVAISFWIILFRSAGRWPNWSRIVPTLKKDCLLGLAAFFAIAPPVYAIQGILTRWFPSEHPIMTMLMESSGFELIIWTSISAIVVAPIAEEFVFRQLLQGWLESFHFSEREPMDVLIGTPPAHKETQKTLHNNNQLDKAIAKIDPANANPYAAPHNKSVGNVETHEKLLETNEPPIWPLFVSAAIFALAHLGHGPDPIPLFVLAMGLGYLYRATHRILPCIIVHFLLNACSMAMLLISLGNNA